LLLRHDGCKVELFLRTEESIDFFQKGLCGFKVAVYNVYFGD
jgi:hypothetical protein